jgi:hypothetical protein
LCDPTLILLNPVVAVAVAAMRHRFTQRLTNGPWGGVMAITRHAVGHLFNYFAGKLRQNEKWLRHF